MRNDTASAPLGTYRRALHVRQGPNRSVFADSDDIVMMSCANEHEALIEVELIRIS